MVEQTSAIITLAMLEDHDACTDQLKLFRKLFGTSAIVTVDACVDVAGKFQWDWAVRLLDDEGRAEYQRVRAAALAEYQRVRAAALAEYDRVEAPAWAEYDRVRAPALAEYDRVRAPALAEYKRVTAPAWATCYIATVARQEAGQ